eukprot:GHRR01021327.1.p1 GENE.GHRR01021327.1~~GHRR01021327.1.p1  ORF type:complete len:246 (+),score=64.10 GHRR01021327.1:180-917(+)
MAAAAQLLKSAWTSKGVRVSDSVHDLSSQQVNIVHIRRPEAAVAHTAASQLISKPVQQAVIRIDRPEAAIEYLLSSVQQPQLQQTLQADLTAILQQLSTATQVDHLRAKLEIIPKQSCPKFHADTVGIRCLCSYVGAGTWYIENRHVKRRIGFWTGDVSIKAVDEQHAVQAEAGDLLYLKGNAFPGLKGMTMRCMCNLGLPSAPATDAGTMFIAVLTGILIEALGHGSIQHRYAASILFCQGVLL